MKRSVHLHIRMVALVMALVLSLGTALSLTPISSRAATVEELQNRLNDLASEESRLRSQLAACRNDVSRQQEYSDSLLAKIQNSEEQIELLRQQVNLLNQELDEKSAAISDKEAAIAVTEQEVEEKFALFGERLRAISQSGNLTALQMVFSTEDFVDYLLKTTMVERIAANDQRMMDELEEQVERLNAEKAQLEADKSALESERAAVETLQADADAKKTELDTLYAESNAVLKQLQASVEDVNTALAAKKREEAQLDAQIKQILAAAAAAAKAAAANNDKGDGDDAGGDAAPSAPVESYTSGTMYWPVPAVHAISSPFGLRMGVSHRGIDIANGSVPVYGQNIVAAADGKVIYTNTSGWGGGYGLFLMIDHGYDEAGNQIVTLYAHCSAILVNAGDTVTGGQTVVARAGSTGDVDGPHLHFEVRVNGTAVDPLANGYVSL